MVRVALVGAGKMGISHLAILGAHPDVEVVGLSDISKRVLNIFSKHSYFPCFADYKEMLEKTRPDAVFVTVPTKYHAPIVKNILNGGIHVFSEKPLALNEKESEELVHIAKEKKLINQVGYHNEFIGTFREMKRLVGEGCLGEIFHFMGESYGPVITNSKLNSWRSDPLQGGGCLVDFASHIIDLINTILGQIVEVKGAIVKPFYSSNVDDSVFALLKLVSGVSGVLSVNWSDETYRKMSTSLTIIGSKAKIICDTNELRVYFKTEDCPQGYVKGWNIKNITDLSQQVNFYLRGEEFTSQIDYFIKAIQRTVPNTINTFENALKTDTAISLIKTSLNN